MEFTLLWAALTAFAAALRDHPAHQTDRPGSTARSTDWGGSSRHWPSGRIAALLMQGTNPIHEPGRTAHHSGRRRHGLGLPDRARPSWPGRCEERPRALDAIAPAALAALAGWHGGCLWRSTCLGTMSDLPWAWALPGSDITRHPVEIYAAILLLARSLVGHPDQGAGRGRRQRWLCSGLASPGSPPNRSDPSLGAGLWWFYGLAAVIGLRPRLPASS